MVKQLVYDVRTLRKGRRVVSPDPVPATTTGVDEPESHKADTSAAGDNVLIGEPIAIYFEDEDLSSDAEKAIRRMAKKSPAFTTLIENLGLTPVGYTEPDSHKRCRKLAVELLRPELVYSKEQLLDLISTKTKGDRLRAEAGFNLMLTARAIQRTVNPDLYYLGNSTPF